MIVKNAHKIMMLSYVIFIIMGISYSIQHQDISFVVIAILLSIAWHFLVNRSILDYTREGETT